MLVETDVEELVSRCLAILTCSYHFARRWSDWVAILDKIQDLAEDFAASGVSFESVRPRVLVELDDRYDRETADRLIREFADLFCAVSRSGPAAVGHRR